MIKSTPEVFLPQRYEISQISEPAVKFMKCTFNFKLDKLFIKIFKLMTGRSLNLENYQNGIFERPIK